MLCVWFCFRLLTARSELSQSGRCRGDEECAEVLAREGSSWFPLRRCEGLKIDPLYIVLNIQQFSCGSKWWSARACVCRTRLINIFVENNFTLEYHTKRATALWRKRMKKVEFHCENLFGFLLNLMTLNHSIYSHKTFSVSSLYVRKSQIHWMVCLQVNHLFEVEDLRDEPESGFDPDIDSYGHLNHW